MFPLVACTPCSWEISMSRVILSPYILEWSQKNRATERIAMVAITLNLHVKDELVGVRIEHVNVSTVHFPQHPLCNKLCMELRNGAVKLVTKDLITNVLTNEIVVVTFAHRSHFISFLLEDNYIIPQGTDNINLSTKSTQFAPAILLYIRFLFLKKINPATVYLGRQLRGGVAFLVATHIRTPKPLLLPL